MELGSLNNRELTGEKRNTRYSLEGSHMQYLYRSITPRTVCASRKTGLKIEWARARRGKIVTDKTISMAKCDLLIIQIPFRTVKTVPMPEYWMMRGMGAVENNVLLKEARSGFSGSGNLCHVNKTAVVTSASECQALVWERFLEGRTCLAGVQSLC